MSSITNIFCSRYEGAIKENHINIFSGVARTNPFTGFVKNNDKAWLDAYLADDQQIKEKLQNWHRNV
jgi:hypothetical protein